MSPLPVRVEMNASRVPSGDQSGRLSVAGLETSSRASPPTKGTVQMSPPETKAISLWSGERLGSASDGSFVGGVMCASSPVAAKNNATRASGAARRMIGMIVVVVGTDGGWWKMPPHARRGEAELALVTHNSE